MKRIRVSESWESRRAAAREGEPHGERIPAWIELRDGRYRLRPGPAKTVRLIFRLCARGLGHRAIIERLETDEVQPFGRAGHWAKSSISFILNSRSAMGEWQPKKGTRRRVPDGEPIPNYFPAAVTEAEWYAAHAARQARRRRSGRPAKKGGPATPFSGLLYAAFDGGKLWVSSRGRHSRLVPRTVYDGRAYEGAKGFRVDHFVSGLLSQLVEVAAAELFSDPGAAQVEAIKGKIGDVKNLLKVAVERFEAEHGSPTWADRITEYDHALRDLQNQLREAQRAATNPLSGTWAEAVELMRRDEPERLRQCLLSTIAEIWCLFASKEQHRLAAVQVWFVGGEARRDYGLLSYSPAGRGARKQEGWVKARSLREVLSVDFDLRDRKQAKAMYAAMMEADWPSLFDEDRSRGTRPEAH